MTTHTHTRLSTHRHDSKPTVQFDGSLYGGTAEISREKELIKSRQNTTSDSKDLFVLFYYSLHFHRNSQRTALFYKGR